MPYDHGIPSVLISFTQDLSPLTPTIVRDGLDDLGFLDTIASENLIFPINAHSIEKLKPRSFWEFVRLRPQKSRSPGKVVITDLLSGGKTFSFAVPESRLARLTYLLEKHYSGSPCFILRPFDWMPGSTHPAVSLLESWIRKLKREVNFINYEQLYLHMDHSDSVHVLAGGQRLVEDSFVDWLILSQGGSVHELKLSKPLLKDQIIPLSLYHGMRISHRDE